MHFWKVAGILYGELFLLPEHHMQSWIENCAQGERGREGVRLGVSPKMGTVFVKVGGVLFSMLPVVVFEDPAFTSILIH